jgi:hypothetical protein
VLTAHVPAFTQVPAFIDGQKMIVTQKRDSLCLLRRENATKIEERGRFLKKEAQKLFLKLRCDAELAQMARLFRSVDR